LVSHYTFNPYKKDITICSEVIERMNLVEFNERKYLTLVVEKEGELIIQGRPGDILTENVIERIFNEKTRVTENPVTANH